MVRITSIGLNMIQVGYRAFILDEFDAEYQIKVYSLSAVQSSFGKFVYSILYLIIAGIVYGVSESEVKMPYYFLPIQIISLGILTFSMILFWKSANETKYDGNEGKFVQKCKSITKEIFSICGIKQPIMYFLFLVVLFGWLCYYFAKDESDQIITDSFFPNCKVYEQAMSNGIIQCITSLCGFLFSILIYKFSHKIETIMLIFFILCGSLMFVYFIPSDIIPNVSINTSEEQCIK